MRFISKVKDPLERSRESVLNPKTGAFYDFVGGIFDTDDEAAMEALTAMGYEAVSGSRGESCKCPHCEFVAKNATGLSAHIRGIHKEKQ
jgi:hypothetical protein